MRSVAGLHDQKTSRGASLRLCVRKSEFCTMFWTHAFQRLRLCRLYVRKEGDFVPIYGYARVSTDGQTLDAQIAQLKAAGAEKVFQEKVSGASVRSLRGY